MNKQQLIDWVAKETGLTKKGAGEAVQAVLEGIQTTVAKGEKVSILGFGTFEQRHRAARDGRNPKTGEKIKIAASKTPGFKAGKAFKNLM